MTLRSKLKRQNRWHEYAVILSILVIIGCAGKSVMDHLFVKFDYVYAPRAIHEVTYRITAGDTLWLLASRTMQSNEDIRDKIIAIRTLNGLTPTQSLMPGQIIKIPMVRIIDSDMRYTLRDAVKYSSE